MSLTTLLDTCPSDKLDAYLFTLCLDINYNGWEGHAETFDSIMWGEVTPPTESEFDSKLATLTTEYNALAWKRSREAEYPSIAELTVALYDIDDKSAVEAKRAAVKAKYPKPE